MVQANSLGHPVPKCGIGLLREFACSTIVLRVLGTKLVTFDVVSSQVVTREVVVPCKLVPLQRRGSCNMVLQRCCPTASAADQVCQTEWRPTVGPGCPLHGHNIGVGGVHKIVFHDGSTPEWWQCHLHAQTTKESNQWYDEHTMWAIRLTQQLQQHISTVPLPGWPIATSTQLKLQWVTCLAEQQEVPRPGRPQALHAQQ